MTLRALFIATGPSDHALVPTRITNSPVPLRGPVGGLPRALDGAGRLSVVRPGQSKCRTAVLGLGGGLYGVRQVVGKCSHSHGCTLLSVATVTSDPS